MYCSREYQTSTRLNQQYEKSTLNYTRVGHETKMLDNKILLLEIDPLVEEGIKAIETITGKIIEIDQEADGTTIRSGDRSGNYPNYNR